MAKQRRRQRRRAPADAARPAGTPARALTPAEGADRGSGGEHGAITQLMTEYQHDELRADRRELLELFERMPADDHRFGDFCYRLAFACWSERDHRGAASYWRRGQAWERATEGSAALSKESISKGKATAQWYL